jgi:hypothetical protein
LASPLPDVAEHLFVKAKNPAVVKWGDSIVEVPLKILHRRLANILRFDDVQFGPRSDAADF